MHRTKKYHEGHNALAQVIRFWIEFDVKVLAAVEDLHNFLAKKHCGFTIRLAIRFAQFHPKPITGPAKATTSLSLSLLSYLP